MSSDTKSIVANVLDALSRGEAWLDDHGTGAWIIAIVAGFILFPPLGLALLVWVSVARGLYRNRAGRAIELPRPARASANRTYEAHRRETVDQMEDEQSQFEDFVDQVRTRRDHDDFDAFLDARTGNGDKAA